MLPALAATIPIGMSISNRMNQNLDRQKFMHSIALDLEQNRGRLGMSGLTYDQATSGGRAVSDMMMNDKGKFFNREQMHRIAKIGTAEGMLDNSGSINNYKRNVKDLIEATEDVVKTLQTTIEGGMSIIKEVNQIGFKTLPQVKAAIRTAKAAGTSTGIGMQNMMQVGAAGARAVQGTPWKASVGASMFQMGAVGASAVAAASPAGAYAVERAGGVAQAGASIAAAQMNMMQSGIGSRMAAYAMNPNGTMNEGKLKTLLSGAPSAYQIVMGANETGYQMGSNRVRFGMFKADMLNQLSDTERSQFTGVMFDKWREGRGGGALNQAYVFAGQYSNDPNTQRLIYQSILGPSGRGRVGAFESAQRFSSADMSASRAPGGILAKTGRGIATAYNTVIDKSVDLTMGLTSGAMGAVSMGWGAVGDVAFDATNSALNAFGGDRYGMMNRRVSYGDTQQAALRRSGAIAPTNMNAKMAALSTATSGFTDLSIADQEMAQVNVIDTKKLQRRDTSEIQMSLNKLNSAIMNNKMGELNRDNNLARTLGVEPGMKWDFQKATSAYNQINKMVTSVGKKYQNMTVDLTERKILSDTQFQTRHQDAIFAVKTRKEGTTAEQALDAYRKKNMMDTGYASEAADYVQAEIDSKNMSKVQTIDSQVLNAAGERAQAVRAYSRGTTAWKAASAIDTGLSVGGAIAGFALESIPVLGWAASKTSGAFYKRAKGMVKRGIDSVTTSLVDAAQRGREKGIDEDLTPYEKAAMLVSQKAGFRTMESGLSKADAKEAVNYFNAIAERERSAAGLAKGEGFTGRDMLAAMKDTSSIGKFIDRHSKQLGKSSDIMRAAIIGDEKDESKIRQNFMNYMAADQEVSKEESMTETYSRLGVELNRLKGERDNLQNMRDGKEKTKLLKENSQKLDQTSAENAQLQTKIMLKGLEGKSGNTASVATPILNYWNNRWVL